MSKIFSTNFLLGSLRDSITGSLMQNNGAVMKQTSKGLAMRLDGVNDYIDCGDVLDFSINDNIIMEASIKATQEAFQCIAARMIGDSTQRGWAIFYGTSGVFQILLREDAPTGIRTIINFPTNYSLNSDAHLILFFDASNNSNSYVILNGIKFQGVIFEQNTLTDISANTSAKIGKRDIGTNFSGDVYDVSFSKEEPTIEESTLMYETFIARKQLTTQTDKFTYHKPDDLSNEVNVIGWENDITGIITAPSTEVTLFEFDFNKTATGFIDFAFMSYESTLFSDNQYRLNLNSGEQIQIFKRLAGVQTLMFATNSGQYLPGIDYSIRITRTTGGVISTYIKGGIYPVYTLAPNIISGTNPFTDTSLTTSSYSSIYSGPGNKISNFSWVQAKDFTIGDTANYSRILEDSLVAAYNFKVS